MKKLEGRTALVSGSGRGIGRAIALKLAAEGAAVVVNDLEDAPAAETVAAIAEAGGRAASCVGDVSDAAFPHRFVETAVERFGGLEIIVNNAGFTWDNVIHKMSDEQWDAVMDVHAKAPFRILRAAAPFIRETAKREAEASPEGRARCRKVVNISSISGLCGTAGQANYAAAKAAQVGLTKTMAKEWGRYNVTVNCVAFGYIETRMTKALAPGEHGEIEVAGRHIKTGIPEDSVKALVRMTPLARPGTPEDAANAVYLLCSPESDFISGQVLVASGGLMT